MPGTPRELGEAGVAPGQQHLEDDAGVREGLVADAIVEVVVNAAAAAHPVACLDYAANEGEGVWEWEAAVCGSVPLDEELFGVLLDDELSELRGEDAFESSDSGEQGCASW